MLRREAPRAQPFRFQVFPAPLRVAGLGKGRGREGRSRAKWVEWRGQTEGNETTFSSHRTVVLLRLLGLPPPPVSAPAGTRCPQVSTGFLSESPVPAQTLAPAVLRPLSDRLLVPRLRPQHPEPGPRKCALAARAKVSVAVERAQGVGAPGMPSAPWPALNTPALETRRVLLTREGCFVPDPLPRCCSLSIPKELCLRALVFSLLTFLLLPTRIPAAFPGSRNSPLLAYVAWLRRASPFLISAPLFSSASGTRGLVPSRRQ